MLNQVILVGRVHKVDEHAGIMVIDIVRKDNKVSDLIPITLSEGIVETTKEYLKVDSTIGVAATINIDNDILRIIGERVTFIKPVA